MIKKIVNDTHNLTTHSIRIKELEEMVYVILKSNNKLIDYYEKKCAECEKLKVIECDVMMLF